MSKKWTGAEIRQTFIDFFVKEAGHTFVPSSSLVPGGDATLLFTNAGMVQFKDVFLGTDKRPYTRAVNSQKCMRVAGKHNDLDDVGRGDSTHTFFEMLGNWSFGDYYKAEAIAWAWQLLTEVWGLDKSRLWATCFRDEKGQIPADEEAAALWQQQPGFDASHVLFFGRKDNFWEMADTGPCGPCSEIHYDRGPEFCDKRDDPNHVCSVNGDCGRYLEIWNLVFMQYNRLDADHLEPLPATHVDTGMGFERIVSLLQGVDSNYKTDLFARSLAVLRGLTGDDEAAMYANFTPYRVIADHARAAAFLIADGVVPGNVGRNYICRMIIRRAARFGITYLGLDEPFLAPVAAAVIETYGDFFPELKQHRQSILSSLTREEEKFARTLEQGTAHLQTMLDELQASGGKALSGQQAFHLYSTYGLPMEITRDIAREQGLEVDEEGFRAAMETHRIKSGGGKAMGPLGGEDAEFYADLRARLQAEGQLPESGVAYNPYEWLRVEGPLLALVRNGEEVESASPGDRVEVLLPATGFYVESGGQVSDTGIIRGPDWEIAVEGMRKPAAGVIVHVGEVLNGTPRRGDQAIAEVDADRRHDTMRNHTATHLLHAALHHVLGAEARQAGSLVAPDRLRFDFNWPQALTEEQLAAIEAHVNAAVYADFPVQAAEKTRDEAIAEGAMALFGEKYGEIVRTITIGGEERHSFELCGGTHLNRTSDIGMFLITSEGSAAAGVRRIEAVTGRGAYALVRRRFAALHAAAKQLSVTPEALPPKVANLQEELAAAQKEAASLRQKLAAQDYAARLEAAEEVAGVTVLAARLEGADEDALRQLTDRFRARYPSGVIVLGTVINGRPRLVAAVTEDLTQRGLHAGQLVKHVAQQVGGGGGGRPTLAQAGGKDPERLDQALGSVRKWVETHLQPAEG